ncbi:hypothetical protein GDO86_011997 [Hymenochirus boettgeri]|uniref:Uncharacterized protein n=1 Tax=Hymenochirus boettgeri TaxID=247094 RepID=A0A8T2JLC0_9PIPI|nr:hypothetical protein GDO86_011997 [Hymenochirus boettgeri]
MSSPLYSQFFNSTKKITKNKIAFWDFSHRESVTGIDSLRKQKCISLALHSNEYWLCKGKVVTGCGLHGLLLCKFCKIL